MNQIRGLLGLLAVYIGSWGLWGEQALMKRAIETTWIQCEAAEYTQAYQAHLRLVTNLSRPLGNFLTVGENRFIVESYDSGRLYEESLLSENPTLLVMAVAPNSNPFVQHFHPGYWLIGSDHEETDHQVLVWGFTRWIPVWSRNVWGAWLFE